MFCHSRCRTLHREPIKTITVMAKKSCMVSGSIAPTRKHFGLGLGQMEAWVPIVRLSEKYSGLLGEKISPRQTLHLLNVQLAAVALLSVEASVAYYLLVAGWFCLALHGCVRAWGR